MTESKDGSSSLSSEHQEALDSIRVKRIIWPTIIGLGVIVYLLWRQFDPEEFAQINWTAHTLFWILFAIFLLVIRHIAYSIRLRILSSGEFSFRKCVQLIFIWEFASAVSPTSVGGSAVALFVLAQEKLSTAKTATIVLYTVVLDTLFFISGIPILLMLFGPSMIRPNLTSLTDIDGWGITFIGAYAFMAVYGLLFFYGLFINPEQLKRTLIWFTKNKWLRKYRRNAVDLGNDMKLASKELWRKKWSFHLSAFLATATAWSCRFLVLNALIIGIVATVTLQWHAQLELYARLQAMFIIMAFSPTPGGAGFAEFVFGGFLSDYVPTGIALVVASIWRIISYYSYLIAGTIVIPNWWRGVVLRRRRKRVRAQHVQD